MNPWNMPDDCAPWMLDERDDCERDARDDERARDADLTSDCADCSEGETCNACGFCATHCNRSAQCAEGWVD